MTAYAMAKADETQLARDRGHPRSPVTAGIAYFAAVFALGFVLGTARTLLVANAPGAGRLVGVLIELPIMLGASWFVCRFVVRRFAVAPTVAGRAAMGGVALALLLAAELLVGALQLGRTAGEHLALYADASYALGLAVQIVFGLLPLVQLRWASASNARISRRNASSRPTSK